MTVMLTDLATAARKSGLKVIEVPGWATRSAAPSGSQWGGPGLDSAPKGILIHHTATAASAPGDYPTYSTILNGNGMTGGPLSQLGLGRSGTVYVFAAGICWHAGRVHDYATQGNRYAIGIEGENPGDGTPWPAEQYDAYVRLAAALADHYGIPTAAIVGHKEASTEGKIDPRFDMAEFRRDVGAIRGARAAAPAPTARVLGYGTTGDDVRRLQAELNRIFPSYSHLAVDGSYGPATRAVVTEFQRRAKADGYYASTIDGTAGPVTQATLRRYGANL